MTKTPTASKIGSGWPTPKPDAPRPETIWDRLPQARNAVDMADRADQIEASTAVLAAMTADLAASAPDGDDGELVGLWLGSWEVYLGDRLAHADALRAGEDRQFRVSVERGEGVDALLDAFADRNRMPSCGDPAGHRLNRAKSAAAFRGLPFPSERGTPSRGRSRNLPGHQAETQRKPRDS